MGGIEAFMAASMLGTRALNAGKITRDGFRKRLETSSWVHICTHGYFKVNNPQLSYLSLKDRLRVLDLTGVVSRAQAVILSACFSSEGSTSHGDDIAGFSHTLLSTGVNVVAGCLWQVNDLATLLHMTIFYGAFRFITIIPGNVFPFLHLWQWTLKRLHSLTAPYAQRLLEKLLLIWDKAEGAGQQPQKLVRGGREKLQKAFEDLTDASGEPYIDFSHPRIWAPFQLTGYADFDMVLNFSLEEQQALYGVQKSASSMRGRSGHILIDLDQLSIEDLLTALAKSRTRE